MYGKLAGAALTLDVPQSDGSIQPVTCRQDGDTAWNAALAALRRRTGSDNAVANAQAQQQTQQQISQAQSQLSSDIQNLQANNVAADLSAVKSDVATLQSLGGQVTPDPSAALKAGHKALRDLKAAVAWATSNGNAIDAQAHQLSNQADNMANC
jgi:hypothetical protein